MESSRLLRCLALGVVFAGLACEPDPLPGSAMPEPSATSAGSSSAAAAASGSGPSSAASADPRKVATVFVGPPEAPGPALPAGGGNTTGKGVTDAIFKTAKNGVLPAGEADKLIKVGEPPQVVVLESGAEPRAALNYDFKPGAKEVAIMKMDMTMKMEAGPTAPPIAMQLPQIEMGLDLSTAKQKEKNGDMPVSGVVSLVKTNVGPNPPQQQVVDAMNAALKGLQGMSLSYVVSPKGRSRDVKVSVPKDAPPDAKQMVDQMKSSFESMVAPLPDDDVGVGARWQVITRLSTGADILQWTTYTLKKRDGNKVQLEAVVNQLAAGSSITGPQMPAGASASIGSFKSGGTGNSSLDLSAVAPESGGGDVKSVMSFTTNGQQMKVETSVALQFSRR